MALVVLVLIATGIPAVRFLSDGNPSTTDQLIEVLGDQSYSVHCRSCGQTYCIPAKDYVAQVAARKGGSDEGIECAKCGAPNAWRDRTVTLRADGSMSEPARQITETEEETE